MSARSYSSIDRQFRFFSRFNDSYCFSDVDLTDLVIQWNPDFSNLQGKKEFIWFEKSGVKWQCRLKRETTFGSSYREVRENEG